jgi:neurotransmitter:Na+ symporter, NSS family
MKRTSWKATMGFYLLAMGSALGLGNLWRLPFVMGENGGGAFFLFYILLAFLIGMPLLIAELMLGRHSGPSPLKITGQISQKTNRPFMVFGMLSVILCVVVLSYYSVLSGWVLHFLARFIASGLSSKSVPLNFEVLMDNNWLQVLLTSVHLVLIVTVVSVGVQEGLEKWIRAIVPLFLIFVTVLLVQTLSLPSTSEVLRFLFYPDFSKMSWHTMGRALAHVFFTMSIGFGLIVSFGSYLRHDEHIPTVGFRITMIDVFVSVLALLFVFPVAFQASEQLTSSNPILLFNVIPQFFQNMSGGTVYGVIFFLCLYLASLNASLALMESLISNLQSIKSGYSRRKSVWILVGVIFSLTCLWVLIPSAVHPDSGPVVLEFLDNVAVNWILPVVALGMLLCFRIATSSQEKREMFIDRNRFVSVIMESHWMFVITWLAPALIILALFLQVVGLILG